MAGWNKYNFIVLHINWMFPPIIKCDGMFVVVLHWLTDSPSFPCRILSTLRRLSRISWDSFHRQEILFISCSWLFMPFCKLRNCKAFFCLMFSSQGFLSRLAVLNFFSHHHQQIVATGDNCIMVRWTMWKWPNLFWRGDFWLFFVEVEVETLKFCPSFGTRIERKHSHQATRVFWA